MRAIVEVESPSYLLHRAQELLHDADSEINRCDMYEAVTKAISLLALHLVKDELRNDHTPPGTRKKRGHERLQGVAKVVKKVVGENPGELVARPGFDAGGDRLMPPAPSKCTGRSMSMGGRG